jgi:amino acid adenylation domain-containing protein
MADKVLLTGKYHQVQYKFWEQYLSGMGEAFSFRQFHSVAESEPLICHSWPMPKAVSDAVRNRVDNDPAGIFVCGLTALGVSLKIFSGLETVTVNVPSLKAMAGPVVQDLPVRMEVKSSLFTRELLNVVNRTVQECYAHQDFPLVELAGTRPFSNVLFRYDDIQVPGAAKYDLDVQLSQRHDQFTLDFWYNPTVYAAYMIAGLARVVTQMLPTLISGSTSVGEVNAVDEAERLELLGNFIPAAIKLPEGQTVISVFEAITRENPAAMALLHGDIKVTYGELNNRANQLAHYLREHLRIQPGDVVAIMTECGDELVAAMLAVLKSGAAYLPVDAHLPRERRKFMLADSKAKVLLTDTALFIQHDDYKGDFHLLDLGIESFTPVQDFHTGICTPDSLAYVIYTSGTTGVPNGVRLTHSGLVNMVTDQVRQFGIRKSDRVLQFASASFDASVSEIFMALCAGAQLLLPQRSIIRDQSQFMQYLHDAGVSVLTLPPSYLASIDWHGLSCLRVLISAGERLNAKAALELSTKLNFFNAYGPTECTVCATINKIEPAADKEALVSIGKPIANTAIYILDEALKLKPIGAVGEICIAGVGVGEGYLNQTALTAEKFVPDPYGNRAGGMLYRTGDLGRWLPDGRIAYLGRYDEQLKVRGFRIEPAEIEAVLQGNGLVDQCVVLAKTDPSATTRLIAFVVAKSFNPKAVEEDLVARLPTYMIPTEWVIVGEIPLTSSGKPDKQQLLNAGHRPVTSTPFAPPENAVEVQLAALWQDILAVETIGVQTDFFECGGDSLSAIRLASAIQETFSVSLTIETLFQLTTISSQASYLAVVSVGECSGGRGDVDEILL